MRRCVTGRGIDIWIGDTNIRFFEKGTTIRRWVHNIRMLQYSSDNYVITSKLYIYRNQILY